MDADGDTDGAEKNVIKDLTSPSPSPEIVRPARSRTQDVCSTSKSFVDLLVPDQLERSLTSAGFITPSPVQQVGQKIQQHTVAREGLASISTHTRRHAYPSGAWAPT